MTKDLSEPGADRDPLVGSPRRVVVATGLGTRDGQKRSR
jgi:hypothetical protein